MRLLCLWIAVTAVISANFVSFSQGGLSSEGVLLEFNQRAVILKDLEEKFQQFVSSPSNDEELRKALQRDFIQSFKTLFKKTDEWILLAMMTSDAERNLLRAELTRNENHAPATKLFFERVVKAFDAAILIHKRANLLMERNSTDVLELEKKGRVGFEIVSKETKAYMTQVAWKGQFRTDVKKFVAKWQLLAHMEADLIAFLQQKYPFRSWLVISRPQTTKQWATCPPKLESIEMPVHGEKTMLVLSVPADHFFNANSAASYLRKIQPESAHILCRSRARDIFNEMQLNCARTSHQFVATVGFSDDRSMPVVATSDPKMMMSKKSLRTWWIFCRRYYQSVIFG